MSTQSHFLTDFDTMRAAAQHVDEVAAAIDAELRALNGRIQPITSSWSGAGSAAFQNLHMRWGENQAKLRQTLAEIAQGIKESADRYHVQEDAVVATMQRQTSNLG